MMNTPFSTSVGLDAAKNSNSNEEWITIHPNNAEEGKGQHIKIDKGNGEIIGGNPHLVKALGENGAKVDPEAAKVDEPGFEAPKDEDFADILGDEGNAEPSFSTPSENIFSELFEDDTNGDKPAETSSEKSFEDVVTETLKEHANKKGLNVDEATLDSWKSKIMTALSGWSSVETIQATLDYLAVNLGTENEGIRANV